MSGLSLSSAMSLSLTSRTGGGGAPAVITALVLTQTSSSGATPFTWSIDYSAAQTAGSIAPGDFWHVRTSTDNFATTLQHITKMVTVDDLVSGVVSFLVADGADADFTTPSGGTTFKLKMTYEREGVGESAESNVLTETITAVVVPKWNSAAKSTYITLSGTDTIATSPVDQGGEVFVIANVGKTTGKWYFEVHVTMGGAFDTAYVGLANSLPADFVAPGSATSTFISYKSNSLVYRNSGNDAGAVQADYSSPTGTKIIGVAFDADADKVWFALANTFAGAPAAGTGGHAPTGITNFYPLFGTQKPTDPGTIKSQTSTMTYTPPAGFSPLGGA